MSTASTLIETTVTPTLSPTIETTTMPTISKTNQTIHLKPTINSCRCDLTLNCDKYCCCDQECSDEILMSFDCEINIEDYYHGEGLERCETSDSLLCVVKDNYSPNYYIKQPPIKYPKYSWHMSPSKNEINDENDQTYYAYGDVLLAYDAKTMQIETFKIPMSLVGDSCSNLEPIRFLIEKKTQCLRSLSDMCAYNKYLLKRLMNFNVFHRPWKANEVKSTTELFKFSIMSCTETFNNCTSLTFNDDDDDEEENFELISSVGFDIQILFDTNGTNISSMTAMLLTHDEMVCGGMEEMTSTKFIQKFEVKFLRNKNQTRDKTYNEGKIGYSTNDLIIATMLRPLNISSPDGESILEYFHNETSEDKDFHLKIPESVDGKCVLNDQINDKLHFNENSLTNCRIEMTYYEKYNKTLCQQVQEQALHHLFDHMNLTANYSENHKYFASRFRLPRLDIDSWTEIDIQNLPNLNPELKEEENSVSCESIATSIKYSFYSSRKRTGGKRKYENVLDNLEIKFGTTCLKFDLKSENVTSEMTLLTKDKAINFNIQIQMNFFQNDDKMMSNNARYFSGCQLILDFF
ncbi:CLUMA_CG004921, isoform A [Clunio marinus]|uniref:CLUMA_CG004921, isoform A n=1 Tax=Clunio marinus TaxID=568069 RepID=A0A1J1HT56_9DIPT|nr:CLUMA_CG004921, isoform A [Clunio marinus]